MGRTTQRVRRGTHQGVLSCWEEGDEWVWFRPRSLSGSGLVLVQFLVSGGSDSVLVQFLVSGWSWFQSWTQTHCYRWVHQSACQETSELCFCFEDQMKEQ